MQHRDRTRRRRAAAAAAVALALAMALGTGGALAQDDDEEDVPLDTKLFRQLMKDIGLQRDGASIDYHERAPLVVPPSRDLPPPVSETSVTANPSWPKDPDVVRRKAEAAAKKKPRKTVSETMEAEARPLSRSELDRGKIDGAAGGSQTPEEAARPMKPSELGAKSFFNDMFSSFSNEGEKGTFTGEPVRESLTAPPPGYQTPSPDQPYGLGAKTQQRKAATVEDRAVGVDH